VFRSADGGASWQAIDSGLAASISAGLELGAGTLALLGQTGDVLVSHDDGLAFKKQPAAAPLPATGLAAAGDGQLVLSSLRGLRQEKLK
jgi:hypothetical protein